MKKITLTEHINTIKKRINYINESPIYKEFEGEDYDEIPSGIFEAGEEDLPPEKLNVPTETPEQNSGGGDNAPAPAEPTAAPAPAAQPETPPVPDLNSGDLPPVGDQVPPLVSPEPAPDVDVIQNDVIKHNLTAIKAIHSQLEMLNSLADTLNGKIDVLSKDVAEVREPTNGEKLANQKKVSYPYYLNLNDNWKDNWFEKSRNESNERGISKLPDGSYIADFDDLNKLSPTDIEKSFNS